MRMPSILWLTMLVFLAMTTWNSAFPEWTVAHLPEDSMGDKGMVDAQIPSESGETALAVFCKSDRLKVVVNFHGGMRAYARLASGFWGTIVDMRFDDEQKTTSSWFVGDDWKIMFYEGATKKFVKHLLTANRFAVRLAVLPDGEVDAESTTQTFQLKGSAEALKPVLDACGVADKVKP